MANFEEALKAMREGRKVKYREEIYWMDDTDCVPTIKRYEYDDWEGQIDLDVEHTAHLYGADIMSDEWEIMPKDWGVECLIR